MVCKTGGDEVIALFTQGLSGLKVLLADKEGLLLQVKACQKMLGKTKPEDYAKLIANSDAFMEVNCQMDGFV